MPADSNQITDARMAIKDLLKDCDTFLSSHMSKGNSPLERAVKRVRWLYGRVDFDVLEHMPEVLVLHLGQYAKETHRAFDEAITITDQGVRSTRSGVDGKIDATYEAAFAEIMTIVNYQISSNADELTGIKENAEQAIERANKAAEDSQAILQESRKTATEKGVAQHGKVFLEEANESRIIAAIWLVLCAFLIALFAVFLSVVPGALSLPDTDSTGKIVVFITTRLAVFSVFVSALLFCARNYAAHRHNYVVNKHRINAVRTYRQLVAATATGEAHDIVLTQAAKCIYEQRDSGYAKGGGNGNISVNISPIETAQKTTKADGK